MSLKSLIKILLSFGLLGIALSFVNPAEVLEQAKQISPIAFAVAILGYGLGQAMSAVKWNLILRAAGIREGFGTALRAYFAGMFANTFGLGLLGGDLARALLMSHGKHRKSLVLASVVADRIHGLTCLSLLGVGVVLLVGSQGVAEQLILIMFMVAAGALSFWFFGARFASFILPDSSKIGRLFSEHSAVLPTKAREFIPITLISISFHLLQVALHWVLCQGMQIDISFSFLLVVIPFINILTSLPVSWNGLGIRENAYIYFLGASISSGQAVLLGALWLSAVLINSAFGGVLALITQDIKLIVGKKNDVSEKNEVTYPQKGMSFSETTKESGAEFSSASKNSARQHSAAQKAATQKARIA